MSPKTKFESAQKGCLGIYSECGVVGAFDKEWCMCWEKTTVLKIRDARGFALKLHSGKFDQNAASQQGTVVSASSKRRGRAL
jgi:hypothetical protein